jgi:hypothetical protein
MKKHGVLGHIEMHKHQLSITLSKQAREKEKVKATLSPLCSIRQCSILLQKQFVEMLFFLGADQKVTHSYKKSAVTIASNPPLEMHF